MTVLAKQITFEGIARLVNENSSLNRRVVGLIEANNREVERRRASERQLNRLIAMLIKPSKSVFQAGDDAIEEATDDFNLIHDVDGKDIATACWEAMLEKLRAEFNEQAPEKPA